MPGHLLRRLNTIYHQSREFDINVFAPYLSAAVTELVKLTEEADTMESKHRVARCLDSVIGKAEIRVCLLPFHHRKLMHIVLDHTAHSRHNLGHTPILYVNQLDLFVG